MIRTTKADIDETVLHGLLAVVPLETVLGLLTKTETNSDGLIAEMRRTPPGSAPMGRMAHKLSGMLSSVGLVGASDLAEQLGTTPDMSGEELDDALSLLTETIRRGIARAKAFAHG